MKLFCLSSAVIPFFFAVPAIAADMPVKTPVRAPVEVVASNWTGFYIGAHVGYGWSRFDGVYDFLAFDLAPKNGLGGIQGGYNFQSGRFVYGIELDGSWTNLRADRVDPGLDVQKINTSFLGSARLRGGVAFDSALVFLSIGAGYANTKFSAIGDTPSPADKRLNAWGLVGGGGLEWAFAARWSVRAEYLHYWLDKKESLAGLTGEAETGDFAKIVGVDVVRIAINYRL